MPPTARSANRPLNQRRRYLQASDYVYERSAAAGVERRPASGGDGRSRAPLIQSKIGAKKKLAGGGSVK